MASPSAHKQLPGAAAQPVTRFITIGAVVRPPTTAEKMAIADGTTAAGLLISLAPGSSSAVMCNDKKYSMHFCVNASDDDSLHAQLGPSLGSSVVKDLASSITHHTLDGDDTLTVLYGATGTGKHHTAFGGTAAAPGLLPQVAFELLKVASTAKQKHIEEQMGLERAASNGDETKTGENSKPASEAAANAANATATDGFHCLTGIVKYRVFLRAWEVTAEQHVNDLLVSAELRPRGGLKLAQIPADADSGFFIPDLLWQSVEEPGEVLSLIKFVTDHTTKRSDGTPRGHVFAQLLYEKLTIDGGRDVVMREAAATFVLLAPHDSSVGGARGGAPAETHSVSHHGHGSINDSLKSFARVLHQAADPRSNVTPDYKCSTLTKLLQHNLEHGSFCCILGSVSPIASAATAETLSFLSQLTESPFSAPVLPKKQGSIAEERRATSAAAASATATAEREMEVKTLAAEIASVETTLGDLKRKLALLMHQQ
jgi:hypothetical protein